MGKLFIVSTPIGNLDDITLRALSTLRSVDLIVCEDTRHTGLLLSHFKIEKPLSSLHDFNEARKTPEIVEKLKNGQNIALLSDAGTPLISDPGFRLVRACVENGITVNPIPGASAVLVALVASGLPTSRFLFIGYPPKKPGQRKKLFESIKKIAELFPMTVVMYQSPYKLIQTLDDLKNVFGDIEIVIAKELTKIHEAFLRDRISDLINYLEKESPKGEFCLLFQLTV